MGFNIGFGFFVLPNVEITAGINLISTSLSGYYGLDWPNEYIYNDIASDEEPAEVKFSEMMVNLGANFHLIKTGLIRPYVGEGQEFDIDLGGVSIIVGVKIGI